MLVIRMQRTGRKGHAQFRVVVQDSRRTPTSGKIVAQIGHFNPHTKETKLDKEKAQHYLDNGAQPSDRVVRLFKAEKIKLPKWVKEPTKQKRQIKNAEKLRRNRPAEPEAEAAPAESDATEAPAEDAEAPSENTETSEPQADEEPAEDAAPAEGAAPAEETQASEASAEEAKPEAEDSDKKPE